MHECRRKGSFFHATFFHVVLLIEGESDSATSQFARLSTKARGEISFFLETAKKKDRILWVKFYYCQRHRKGGIGCVFVNSDF